MATRSLDQKLDRIRAGKYRPTDFIIADAKDPDMGFGLPAPGPDGKGGYKSLQQFLDAMVEMTESGLVDIMLMSASSAETLVKRGVFKKSKVTPAIRFNDTSDIWSQRGSTYGEEHAQPFATAELPAADKLVDLGLYAVTFGNTVSHDRETLEAYRTFRRDIAETKLRYFLEVFNPKPDPRLKGAHVGAFINDSIVRTLAGITQADRPLFLKMAYNGPKALEELAAYDPGGLIVGILGGGKGTTRDTFELVHQAEKYGGRVALFGRKINLAESPIELVSLMRAVVEGDVGPAEAVKAYHDKIKKAGLKPQRALADDTQITEQVLKG